MRVNDFTDLRYLVNGTDRQKHAYAVLAKLQIMETLHKYDPILVGTIPLDIDIGTSDLDIVCCAADVDSFLETVFRAFGQHDGYAQSCGEVRGRETTVIQFRCEDFEVELFAQHVPSKLQNGYRHMVIEARMLAAGGQRMRDEIRRLKRSGLKTEPAFMHYLQIDCADPYTGLLAFEAASDEELKRLLAQ